MHGVLTISSLLMSKPPTLIHGSNELSHSWCHWDLDFITVLLAILLGGSKKELIKQVINSKGCKGAMQSSPSISIFNSGKMSRCCKVWCWDILLPLDLKIQSPSLAYRSPWLRYACSLRTKPNIHHSKQVGCQRKSGCHFSAGKIILHRYLGERRTRKVEVLETY